ncbi:MAG: hypothetical protein QXT73_06715 [Candidatus Methanomethylicaceae archaeon]
MPWHFVTRQAPLAEINDLLGGYLTSCPQDYCRRWHLPLNLIVLGEYSRLCYFWVPNKHILNLGWVYLPTRHNYHVLFTRCYIEHAVFIQIPQIAGQEPSARNEGLSGLIIIPPIALAYARTPHCDLPYFARSELYFWVPLVHYLDLREPYWKTRASVAF